MAEAQVNKSEPKYGFTAKVIPFFRNGLTGVAIEGLRRGDNAKYVAQLEFADGKELVRELKRKTPEDLQNLLAATLANKLRTRLLELDDLGTVALFIGTDFSLNEMGRARRETTYLKREIRKLIDSDTVTSNQAKLDLRQILSENPRSMVTELLLGHRQLTF